MIEISRRAARQSLSAPKSQTGLGAAGPGFGRLEPGPAERPLSSPAAWPRKAPKGAARL